MIIFLTVESILHLTYVSQGGWIQIVNTGLWVCLLFPNTVVLIVPSSLLIIFMSKKGIYWFTSSLFVNLILQVELTLFNCSFGKSPVSTSKIVRQYHNYRVVYHSLGLEVMAICSKGPRPPALSNTQL